MIHVDGRAGSAPLAPMLRARGLPVTLSTLSFGDVRFCGIGPGGEPATVGIEVKSIHDVLHCITDGRFAGHQLPGMMRTYDQSWLLVEGQWRARKDTGILQYLRTHTGAGKWEWRDAQVGARKFMYRDLLTWLFTIQTKTGMLVCTLPDWEHASAWISTLYSWWTATKRVGGEDVAGWESHRSHLAVNVAGENAFWGRVKQEERENGHRNGNRGSRLIDRAIVLRPSVLRLVASQLPGVGYARSEQVAKKFRTVAELVQASVGEIAEVEGIGKKGAGKIWEAIHGGRAQ